MSAFCPSFAREFYLTEKKPVTAEYKKAERVRLSVCKPARKQNYD